jgi:hypothetical protein
LQAAWGNTDLASFRPSAARRDSGPAEADYHSGNRFLLSQVRREILQYLSGGGARLMQKVVPARMKIHNLAQELHSFSDFRGF